MTVYHVSQVHLVYDRATPEDERRFMWLQFLRLEIAQLFRPFNPQPKMGWEAMDEKRWRDAS